MIKLRINILKVGLISLAFGMANSSCQKDETFFKNSEDRFYKRLTRETGLWTIAKVKTEEIKEDGNELISEDENAGVFCFIHNGDSPRGYYDFTVQDTLTYNAEFGFSILGSTERVNIYVNDGSGNLNDTYFNVEKNKRSKQVWYVIGEDSMASPGAVYKTTYYLEFCDTCTYQAPSVVSDGI